MKTNSFTKNKIKISIVCLTLITLACVCSTSTPEVRSNNETSPNQPIVEPTDAPIGSSRENPAPLGTEVLIDGLILSIQEATRPADDIVAQGNMFNQVAEPDHEFMMIKLSITCDKGSDQTCNITGFFNFSLVGSTGIVRNPELLISGVPGLLESTEFYGGATVSGSLIFQVNKGETNLVMIYEALLGLSHAYLLVP